MIFESKRESMAKTASDIAAIYQEPGYLVRISSLISWFTPAIKILAGSTIYWMVDNIQEGE